MIDKGRVARKRDELRQRAEKRAQAQELLAPELLETLSLEQTRTLLHTLQVHKVELEMQNDQLFLAQLDLEIARERSLDLYELAPVGYCSLSETGVILHANLTAANLLGVFRQELVGEPITRFIHPEDQDIYYLQNRKVFSATESRGCELRLQRQGQTPFWVRLEVSAVLGETGRPERRLVFVDISEQKRLATALAASEARLGAVTEAVAEGIVLLDPAGRIVSANPAVARMFGYSGEEVIGMAFEALLGRQGDQAASAALPAGMLPTTEGGGGERKYTLPAHRKDGQEIAIELLLPALPPQDDGSVLAILRERTDQAER